MNKKKYFEDKLKGVQKTIWDFEFKRYKTGELYEEIRQEYDNLRSKLAVLENRIESEKKTPTMEKGDVARLGDDKVRLDKEIERAEAQMKDLDCEMHGAKPSAENPNGVQGIDQTIDALQELMSMIKDYIKKI